MGVLRLLYCDSAGVRRCKAVVYRGDLPAAPEAEAEAEAEAEERRRLPPQAAAALTGQLSTTPSMLDAAAAGVISVRHPKGPSRLGSAASLRSADSVSLLPALAGVVPAAALVQGGGPFAVSRAAALAAAEGAAASGGGSFASSRSGSPPRASQGALAPSGGSLMLRPLTPSQTAAARAAAPYSTCLTAAAMGHPVTADLILPGSGVGPVGEVVLLPDLAAAVRVPWAEGHSVAPVDMMDRDLSKPFSCCPRSALKHALSALELAHGLQLTVGFELEFFLLKPCAPGQGSAAAAAAGTPERVIESPGLGPLTPLDDSVYCQSSSFDRAAAVLDEMVAALDAMGIGVMQYHAESAPGQFEIATGPYPALQAADKLLLSKEAVSAVARRHGLEATFLPKPLAGAAGSGCHCHFSLSKAPGGAPAAAPAGAAEDGGCGGVMAAAPGSSGASLAAPGYPALSATASAFLAGVLRHLPALLPLTAASANSYDRLRPGAWAGAHAAWGFDNREAPLRVCCPPKGGGLNVEYKAMDGTANPYIAVAAIVAAGMQGLQELLPLPPPLQHVPSEGGALDEAPPLPRSLGAALDALDRDSVLQLKLQQLLGADLLNAYAAVKRYESGQDIPLGQLLLRY